MEFKIFTAEEVANTFKVSNDTIYRLAKENQIEFIKVGRQMRFTEDAVNKYITTHTRKAKNNQFLNRK